MTISIITVLFNSVETVGDTLRSVSNQKWDDWEHVLVDGGSDDGTLEYLASWDDSRRVVYSESDRGIYDAMNKGLTKVSGDVIGFLNADDFFESREVLAIVAEAFADDQVDLVFGNLRYVENKEVTRVVRDWRSEPYRSGMFARGWMPPHPTVYARREVFEKFGRFDEDFSICADWEWLFRVFEIGGVKSLHIDEYFVRMRLGGASNGSPGAVLRSNGEALRAFRKHGKSVPMGFLPGKIWHRGKQFWRALF
ncbi:MAG: glycosyltransferase family 2 protein [Verrucomicrobiota bacterium]